MSKKPKNKIIKLSAIAQQICDDEIAWGLYNECERGKKNQEIKLCLQPVVYPTSLDCGENALKKLKKKKVINEYKIITEETKGLPIVFEEPEAEIALSSFASYEDHEKAPKINRLLNTDQEDYIAIIKCDPKKVLKVLKEEYKKINQKRKEIIDRENILESFKAEPFLTCEALVTGEILKFGTDSGYFIYGKRAGKFKPGTRQYRIFKELMEHPNRKRNKKTLLEIMMNRQLTEEESHWKPGLEKLTDCINNLRQQLGMTKVSKINADLIESCDGYRIRCKK